MCEVRLSGAWYPAPRVPDRVSQASRTRLSAVEPKLLSRADLTIPYLEEVMVVDLEKSAG